MSIILCFTSIRTIFESDKSKSSHLVATSVRHNIAFLNKNVKKNEQGVVNLSSDINIDLILLNGSSKRTTLFKRIYKLGITSTGPYRSKIFSSFLCSKSAGKLNTAMVFEAGDRDRRPRDRERSRPKPRDRDRSLRPRERDRLGDRDLFLSSRLRSSGDRDRRDS